MSLANFIRFLLGLFLFLLPWQTRWVYAPAFLTGAAWEYGTLSIYATEFLLGLIITLALIDLIRRRVWRAILEPGKARRRLIGFGAVLLFLLFITLNSQAPALSTQWVSWGIAGAAAAALLLVYGADRIKMQTAFWLGGAGQGMLAVWQFATQQIFANKWLGLAAQAPGNFVGEFVVETMSERWLRAYGSFGSPNMLGGFLAVVFALGLGLYLNSQSSKWKAWLLVGQMIILSGLALSFSRGAWLAAGAGALACVGVLVQQNKWREQKKDFLKIMMYSGVVLVILVFLFKPLFTARVRAEGRLENKSLAMRTEQYSEWAGVFKNENLFLGVGPGAYTAALFQLNPARPGWAYQPVHNVYLLVLAEIGVVGFTIILLFFCFLVGLIKKINPAGLPVIAVVLTGFLFDHFWWSLYGGVLLAVVSVGFGLSTIQRLDE